MKQLHIFAPAEKQIQREQRRQEARPVKWATPVTRAELVEGTKRMAAKMMNTNVWPEYPKLYDGPRDKYIVLMDYEDMASVMAGTRKRRKITLGPFHTSRLECLPLSDRKKVLDVMIANPYFNIVFKSVKEEQAPQARKLSPESLLIVRKRKLMKRVLKRFGMFADEMIRRAYEDKEFSWAVDEQEDYLWTEADVKLWAEEKAKFGKPKGKRKKKRKARSTDNDQFEEGAILK